MARRADRQNLPGATALFRRQFWQHIEFHDLPHSERTFALKEAQKPGQFRRSSAPALQYAGQPARIA
jgi:hypothetical protein